MQTLQPKGWPRPSGFSNGIAASGRMVFVAGQIGWDETCRFQTDDFVEQVRQTLLNTVAVLREGGAGPEHVCRMTWYILDKREYVSRLAEVGQVYREVMGKVFPAMAMVQVGA